MIFHVVALDDWLGVSDRPYAPASLSEEGFVHCSPDEAVTLAVASAFHHDTPGPLMVLLINEHKLDVMVRWEAASPVPPPGVAPAVARGQNRALVYDPARDLVLLVLGTNDRSQSRVYALRFQENN